MIFLKMELTAKDLLKANRKLCREIRNMNVQIKIKETEINKNESEIFKICDHDWEYDINSGQYDRIKYKCTKCYLWKCRSMYSGR